jgi:hypothetical protein
MLADFNFREGTYWIYIDSVSGQADSAYIVSNSSSNVSKSCVDPQPVFQQVSILIDVNNGNTASKESWSINMMQSDFDASFSNSADSIENLIYFTPISYPFTQGGQSLNSGCVLSFDSASVSGIAPSMNINNQSYTNTAKVNHTGISTFTQFTYDDCFYICPGIGFVKLVFNHPADSVFRVLELQRYKIVK